MAKRPGPFGRGIGAILAIEDTAVGQILVRPRQRPVTNVVAMVVVLVTFLPILAAYYLTRDGDQIAGAGK